MPGLHAEADPNDYRESEQSLVSELRERAMQQITGVNSQSDVHVRDILPNEDLTSGGDNDWNGTNRAWVQSGMESDQLHETYTLDAGGETEGKVVGFYAIEAQSATPNTTEIMFEDGTGSRFERLMFHESHATGNAEFVAALMRNPIIFDEGKDGAIQQWSDDGSATATVEDELVFHGVVAEKAGTTLGTRSQGENAPAGVARGPV